MTKQDTDTITLLDVRFFALQQADTYYDGNLSEYLRVAVRKDEDEKQIIMGRQKKQSNEVLLQACTFLFMALTLFLLPICLFMDIDFLLLLGVCFSGGILFLLQMVIMLNKQKRGEGKTWS